MYFNSCNIIFTYFSALIIVVNNTLSHLVWKEVWQKLVLWNAPNHFVSILWMGNKICTCISEVLIRVSDAWSCLWVWTLPFWVARASRDSFHAYTCQGSQPSRSNLVFISLERKWSCRECLGNVCQEREKGIEFLKLHFSLNEENTEIAL